MSKKNFYTRTGDMGTTGIIGSERMLKSDLRIEAIGSVDEANAALGFFRSFMDSSDTLCETILRIQKKLYFVMSDLASQDADDERFVRISEEDVSWLEAEIAKYEENLNIPRDFIIPGDHPFGAMMDLARTIVRRAERALIRYYQVEPERNPALIKFLNRLSSFCYLAEIYVLQIKKKIDITSVKDL
jgi:cob(I)alamin adenosyltransferase